MHFEILIEDSSGAILIESLFPRILADWSGAHTCRIIPYKGIGRLPRDLRHEADPSKRALLNRLPQLLAGYGKAFREIDAAVIVLVDLDDKDCVSFRVELMEILQRCNPKPSTLFWFAIEEMEAWLLGDRAALLKIYPKAKINVLDSYVQDSICGTWEKLADAIFPKGSRALLALGYPRIGEEKCRWASNIGPLIDVEANQSASFQGFKRELSKLAGTCDSTDREKD